jgi:hypothetical protein
VQDDSTITAQHISGKKAWCKKFIILIGIAFLCSKIVFYLSRADPKITPSKAWFYRRQAEAAQAVKLGVLAACSKVGVFTAV